MHGTLALEANHCRFFFRYLSENRDWPEEVNTGGEKAATMQRGTTANPCAQAAEKAYSYGKNAREENIGFRDLDAVDIAVSIQEASGNYFVTMWALDILLSDGE